ncbi:ester cyclase [Haladaptatus sp. NG-SE-30]
MATSAYTTDQMKDKEEQFVAEIWNEGNFESIDELVSDEYVGHWFGFEDEAVDFDGLKKFIRAVRTGFPDFEMNVEFMFAEEDMITVGFTAVGTHEGEFMGVPPTGKEGEPVPGIMVHRFEDGKVIEGWAVWDSLGLMQQLGVIPEKFSLASFLETTLNLTKQDVLKRTGRKA